MNDAWVFAKTVQGADEINQRSLGLGSRLRRLLILVDGRRSVADLRRAVQLPDLEALLSELEAAGCIEAGSAPVTAPAASQQTDGPGFRDHPAPDDPERLARARNFMVNTLQAFVGALGTTALIERLEAAGSLTALRLEFAEWYDTLQSTREGRRQAEELRARLLQTI